MTSEIVKRSGNPTMRKNCSSANHSTIIDFKTTINPPTPYNIIFFYWYVCDFIKYNMMFLSLSWHKGRYCKNDALRDDNSVIMNMMGVIFSFHYTCLNKFIFRLIKTVYWGNIILFYCKIFFVLKMCFQIDGWKCGFVSRVGECGDFSTVERW